MKQLFLSLALAGAIAAPAAAQSGSPLSLPAWTPPAAEQEEEAERQAPAYETVPVVLATDRGTIKLEIETERAPATAANFLRYVDEGRLDGTSFYRASNVGEGYGLVQGGTKGDPDRVLPPVAHEPTSETGLTHQEGTISMAMGEPGTADGDFFIIVGDLVSLDAKDGAPGFAAFGRVTEGMETVKAILNAPIDPNEGEGVMRGQYLADPVGIVSARRAD